ncbi:hypothetical protein [Ottowia testudinis]|uniref:tRNA A-37 threonylcarbamoyl transferase component Bud32 n=1 Tax=Ottowia testudinis TaxID=2816950 RepID=A0A975CJS2_9BURK|nr:hypothetical protein [Ottowia testudinis]QTD46884.1 hypothetical protein J1M35_08445 [Ottowia testudinis]
MALTAQDLDRFARSPGWRASRLEVFDSGAGKVIVKGQRAPRHPARYRLLNWLARGMGLPLLKAAPMHGGARAQAVEIERLSHLRAAGMRVPEVLHVAPDHFVMQWLGEQNLASLLQARHPHAMALWREGANALVQLHAAGQYLSQGFARNLIVDEGPQPPRLAGMIDFEDDPLEVMTLVEAQVRDWLSYLHSSLWSLGLPAAQLDAVLDEFMARESAAVRALFFRICDRLGWLRLLPATRRLGREVVSLQALADAAHRYRQRHGAALTPVSQSTESDRTR